MLSACCKLGIRLSLLYVLYMVHSIFMYGVLYVYIDMIEIHEYMCVYHLILTPTIGSISN